MTSLAVHLSYNNNNNNNNNISTTKTPREKHSASLHHLTKNSEKNNNILSINTSNNNSSNLNSNDLNYNNNNSNLLIGVGIGDSSENSNNKSSEIGTNGIGCNFSTIYNNLKLNDQYGVNVNGSNVESNSNNFSSNYALINRIKAFETQQKNFVTQNNKQQRVGNNNQTKKLIKQTVLTNTNSNNNNNYSLISTRNTNNNPKLNLNNHLIVNEESLQTTFNTFLDNNKNESNNLASNNNNIMATMSSQSPTAFERAKSAIRTNGTGSRSTSKSQEDFYRYKLKTPNVIMNNNNQQNNNVYHDKITDQTFFNRNFKLKPTHETNTFNSSSYNIEDTSSNNMMVMVNGNDHISRIKTAVGAGVFYQNEREKSADRIINSSSSFQNGSGNVVMHTQTNNNINLASVNNQINKLKLLKKRNALKKSLTNNIFNHQSTPPINTATTNTVTSNLINSSKEDFKSQTSLNGNKSFTNNNGRPLSMHLSRNSLNNIEQITNSQFSGSNPHLLAQTMVHKSSETIDELVLNEMKLKESDRVKSTSRLNNNRYNNLISLKSNIRTKSENELHNINEISLKKSYQDNVDNNKDNEASYTAYKSLNMNNSFINRMKASANLNIAKVNNNRNNVNLQGKTHTPNNSRLDNSNANKYNSIKLNHSNKIKQHNFENNNTNEENDDYDNVVSDQKEFRIVYPGYNPNIVSLRNVNNGHHNNGVIHTTYVNNELFEISPYNIMSDPVISEQFRRLYDEDEYFQQVHRKVSEWLNKYVFIEMENQTFDRTE